MDSYAIQTVVQENGETITTIVDTPIEVTSVNGMTGDVQVEPKIEGFQANHYYTAGTAITYDGKMYIASSDFTSGSTFDVNDWSSPGFVQTQADYSESDTLSNAFIRNKPTMSIGTSSTLWGNNGNEGSGLSITIPSGLSVNRVDSSYASSVNSAANFKLVLGVHGVSSTERVYTRYYGIWDGSAISGAVNYNPVGSEHICDYWQSPGAQTYGGLLYKCSAVRMGHPKGVSNTMWIIDTDFSGEGTNSSVHISAQVVAQDEDIVPGIYVRYSPYTPDEYHREATIWLNN